MQRRLAALAVLALEGIRYLVAEIRAGHISTSGIHAYQFYANELLAARYRGFRKEVVASFVLFSALREQDTQALHIVLQQEEGKVAVTKLRSRALLKRLQEWALANARPDIAALATSRIKIVRAGTNP